MAATLGVAPRRVIKVQHPLDCPGLPVAVAQHRRVEQAVVQMAP